MKKRFLNIRSIIHIIFLTFVLLAAFAYVMFQGGFVSWFLFYSVVCILIITVTVAFFPLSNLTVTRKIDKNIYASGEQMNITVSIKRKWPYPFIYLAAEDHLPGKLRIAGQPFDANRLFFFSLKKELSYTYKTGPLPRGEYQFEFVEVRTGDLFGLFSKERKYKADSTILVYPKCQEIKSWDVFSKDQSQADVSFYDDGDELTSVSGVRDYVKGDRLYNIHWKATARMNKLMTKEFEAYQGQSCLIVLDCSLRDHHQHESFEKSVEFAASIVRYGIDRNVVLDFASIGDNVRTYPNVVAENKQLFILQQLAKITPTSNSCFTQSFGEVINKSTAQAVIMISTAVNEDLLNQLKASVAMKKKIVFCLVSEEQRISSQVQEQLDELTRIHVSAYTIKSDNFNEDLKAGEQYVRL